MEATIRVWVSAQAENNFKNIISFLDFDVQRIEPKYTGMKVQYWITVEVEPLSDEPTVGEFFPSDILNNFDCDSFQITE